MAGSSTKDVFDSPYFKNKAGERYGSLVVLESAVRKNGRIYWLCECDCGSKKEIASNRLRDKGVKSCGCKVLRGNNHPNWSGCKDFSGTYWCSVRQSAKKRGIFFDLSKRDALEVYRGQEGRCVYSGESLSFDGIRTASLDRIDSLKGYEVRNIQWVHTSVNRMKWKFSQNDFLRWCYLVVMSNIGRDLYLREKRGVPKWLLGRFKNIAKRRSIDFEEDVSSEYLWGIYLNQGGLCAYTGLPILFPVNSYKRKTGTASLDRINSSKGYEVGNLQWVHKDINQMKGSLSHFEFINFCKLIVENSQLLAELSENRVVA